MLGARSLCLENLGYPHAAVYQPAPAFLLSGACWRGFRCFRLQLLLQELDDFSRVTGRPPFSTSAYIFPSARKPLSLEDAERLSGQISEILTTSVGLPLRHLGFQISSGGMMILPSAETEQVTGGETNNVRALYVADIEEHMHIVDGKSMDKAGSSGEILDVWVHERLAEKAGANVGDTLIIGSLLGEAPIPVRLAGIWRARDLHEEFWFTDPDSSLKDVLLVHCQDYINHIQPVIPSRSKEVNWYVGNAPEVLPELVRRARAGGLMPDLVTDQTSAHDLVNGYLPAGWSVEQWQAAQADPAQHAELAAAAAASCAKHVQAMLDFQALGAKVVDYGNNIRQVRTRSGREECVRLPGLRARVHPSLVLRGQGAVPLGRAVRRS